MAVTSRTLTTLGSDGINTGEVIEVNVDQQESIVKVGEYTFEADEFVSFADLVKFLINTD